MTLFVKGEGYLPKKETKESLSQAEPAESLKDPEKIPKERS